MGFMTNIEPANTEQTVLNWVQIQCSSSGEWLLVETGLERLFGSVWAQSVQICESGFNAAKVKMVGFIIPF